jgi:hypothetical protein
MRRTCSDRAGAASRLPAQRASMWVRVGEGLVNRVAEHVVEKAQQALEGPRSSLEHMFGSVGLGPDGTEGVQRILHPTVARDDKDPAKGQLPPFTVLTTCLWF